MPEKPVMHGPDHRPGGFDPTPTGPWHNIGDPGEPDFVTGSNASPTALVPNPSPMQFRLSVGAPNMLTRDGTAIMTYTKHQVEISGDVTGVASGDVVFVLPLAYRHEVDRPVPAHDDSKAYVPCRLLSTGEFLYDVV